MKVDPISTHERSLIIHHLSACGKWQGNRMGAQVTFTRYQIRQGNEIIQFSVAVRHKLISSHAPTVFAAVEEVNRIIRGSHITAPLAGRDVRDPERRGAAPLVRREA